MYLIGLTGNIACGKSSVLAMLRELGAAVIDADAVTRALQQPGTPVYAAIVHEFPFAAPQPAAPLDRRALGALVFADPAALKRLEQIVHPAVRSEILAWIERVRAEEAAGGPRVAVIDAILLLESGYDKIVDAVWVVTCTREQQLQRLITTRGMSEAEALSRIDAQRPQAEKIARASLLIDNSGTLEQTRAQVLAAWSAILA